MRNTWKGLVVGGLTGIAGGAILDVIGRTSRRARELGAAAKGHVPDATSWLKHATEAAAERVHDADVPGRVHDVSTGIATSDAATRVAKASKDVASKISS
jgi:hypothetical protein